MITLDQILASTTARVAALRASARTLAPKYAPRGFLAALAARQQDFAVIAEIKRASPSRGPIRPDLDVATLTAAYQQAGAAAISVLTEPEFFRGQPADLTLARNASHLPLLRKDFIIDEIQLDEALHHGADAVLLIASALADRELAHLKRAAEDRQLDVLIEVHDAHEIERVRSLDPAAIGVNNRNLRTMQVDVRLALDVAPLLPPRALWVAESGLRSGTEMAHARKAGYRAFLIGEWLLAQPDPGANLVTLLTEARAWSG